MNDEMLLPDGYSEWRKNIEELIEVSKLRAAINVNMDMLSLYWNIGSQIIEKQERLGWGKKIIGQLSKDLSLKFADDRGYSERNLRNMKRFAAEYPNFPFLQVPLASLEGRAIWQVPLAKLKANGQDFVQVPLAQVTWYHHISLLSKVKDEAERAYYIVETAQNGWSRDVCLCKLQTDISMQKAMPLIILTRLFLLCNQIWLDTYSKIHTVSVFWELSRFKMSWILRKR